MKGLTRWQDGVALVAGVYALLSPLWTETSTTAMWSLIVLGALIAAASLAPLAGRTMDSMEYAHAGLGVLLFIAPWVFGYADLMGAAWTSWIVGVVTVVVGLMALPMMRHIGGGRAAPQH
jgi:uncharacterized SAM-binding protein YcdF (DUF218 family)